MNLYYIAPKESRDSILKNGILPPQEVLELIKQGKLDKEVLGVSYSIDSSNFPQHVSLIENPNIATTVAQQICFAKTGLYTDPEFMAIGYVIKPEIREHKEFINQETVRQMHSDPYPSEVLYHGKIPLEFIEKRQFAARTH
ncbi:hypothetical protein HN903_02945 [archaeon]|jgi:hypothetical protein|nr:hypothetical protein [archaeon]MBT7128689.1 hypothetical protein [archaeon]